MRIQLVRKRCALFMRLGLGKLECSEISRQHGEDLKLEKQVMIDVDDGCLASS